MNDNQIDSILRAPGVSACAPLASNRLAHSLASLGLCLPSLHKALLLKSNGLTACLGHHRVFGFAPEGGRTDGLDLRWWNRTGTWKHAWPGQLAGMLCFAESCWGDQYAYDLSELRDPARCETASVYLLDAFTMRGSRLGTFADYLRWELREVALEAYDDTTKWLHHRFGVIPPQEHLVFLVPPSPTGDRDDYANAARMGAVGAMIRNGDLSSAAVADTRPKPALTATPECETELKKLESGVMNSFLSPALALPEVRRREA